MCSSDIMKATMLLAAVGVLIGMNTLIFLGWGAMQPHVEPQRGIEGFWSEGQQAQQMPKRVLAASGPSVSVAADDEPLHADGPITELLCVDRLRTGGCHSWHCSKDAEVRWVSCKATCGTCKALRKAITGDTGVQVRTVSRFSKCKDEHPDCPSWGARCRSDANNMLKLCQLSCGFCKANSSSSLRGSSKTSSSMSSSSRISSGVSSGNSSSNRSSNSSSSGGSGSGGPLLLPGLADEPLPCMDDLKLCPYFKQQGLCRNGSMWMQTQCRESCKQCTPGASSGTNVSSVKLLPLVRLKDIQQPDDCRDYNTMCAEWAFSGNCNRNPSFMHLHCRASCNACHQQVLTPAHEQQRLEFIQGGILISKQDPRKLGGHAPWQQVHARRPPPPPPPSPPPPPVKVPETSDKWAPFWVCGSPGGELDVSRECVKMDTIEMDPCEDSQKECTLWAKQGECKRNPDYMLRTCKESCGGCISYYLENPPEYQIIGDAANKTAEKAIRKRKAKAEDPDVDNSKDEDEDEEDADEPLPMSIPSVGFGTAGLGDATAGRVEDAVRNGYVLIDTAEARDWYREDLIMKGVTAAEKMRENLFLVSKIHPRDLGQNASRAAFERILRDLQTDYLDLLLMHYPRCFPGIGCDDKAKPQGDWRDTWREMERILLEGKARAIGISNFNSTELLDLLAFAKIKPAVLQAHSDPLDSNSHLLNLCLEKGIMFMSYSMLGTQYVRKPGDPNPVLNDPAIKSIAEELSRSPAQVVVRWALQRGMVVIPRSSNAAHMQENLDVFDFELDEDYMSQINALDGTYKNAASAAKKAEI